MPFPKPGSGQSFADVDTDSGFQPFLVPGLVQSFADVSRGPGYVPLPTQPSTLQGETTPIRDEKESVNNSVNGAYTTSSFTSAQGRKRKRGLVQEPDNTNMVEFMSTLFTEMLTQIGQLVSKVGAESDACSKRKVYLMHLISCRS